MDAGPGPVSRPQASLLGRDDAEGRWGPAPVVALLATLLVLVAGCAAAPPSRTARVPLTSSPPKADVPWAALEPTYPTIPRHTTPAFPDPAKARRAVPCHVSDLRASSELDAETGGTWILSVHLRSAGRPCRLAGRPTVTVLDGDRPLGVATVPARGRSPWYYPEPVLLEPRTSALVTLTWGKEWCTAPLRADKVRLELPGGAGGLTLRGFRGTPPCTLPLEEVPPSDRHGSPVVVGSFAPQRWRAARVVSPYAGVGAVLRRTAHARPGRPLDFEVELTARRDVPLDPCPDFTIEQYLGDRRSREDRYALNCAGVPTKDGHGRPYLPAGQQVTFAMHTGLLDAGAVKFIWTLDVPEHVGDSRALPREG